MAQADWNQTDETKADYIKNKPNIPTSGEGNNSIQQENTEALGPNSAAFGSNTIAGGKAFHIDFEATIVDMPQNTHGLSGEAGVYVLTPGTDIEDPILAERAFIENLERLSELVPVKYTIDYEETKYWEDLGKRDSTNFARVHFDIGNITAVDVENRTITVDNRFILMHNDTIIEADGLPEYKSNGHILTLDYPDVGDVNYGYYSFSANEGTRAIGNYGFATGRNTKALDNASTAMGHTTVALKYAFASGVKTQALGSTSFATGKNVTTKGYASSAFGGYTQALSPYSFAEGNSCKAGDSTRANDLDYNMDGEGAQHAEGSGTNAVGRASHSQNIKTKALGEGSHAGGLESEARGVYSFAHGYKVIANGYQTVVGKYNKELAGPASATVEDDGALFVVGNGISATTSGRANGFVIKSDNSFQMGATSKVNGKYSMACGYKSTANGESSVVMGQGLMAGAWQTVVGKYNKPLKAPSTYEGQNDDEAVFIVGTGRGATSGGKKNGFVVWGDGHATVGRGPILGADVANKDYVDNTVASLVNSAPETLNTLNELSKALGDDPNFATTITNELAKKVNKVDGKNLSSNDYSDIDKDVVSLAKAGYVLKPTEYKFGNNIPVDSKYGATLIGFDAVGETVRCSKCNDIIPILEEIKSLEDYGIAIGDKYNYVDIIEGKYYRNLMIYSGASASDRKVTAKDGSSCYSISTPKFLLNDNIPARFILNGVEFTYSGTCTSLSTACSKGATNNFVLLSDRDTLYFFVGEKPTTIDYQLIYQPETRIVETFVASMKTSLELAEDDVINNYDANGNVIDVATNGKVVVTTPVAINNLIADSTANLEARIAQLEAQLEGLTEALMTLNEGSV